MLHKSKRGEMKEYVPILIIVLLSGLIIFGFTGAWANLVTETKDRQICTNSVILKAKTKVVGTESSAPLDCLTYDINFKTANREKILEGISDEFYWCDRQMGSGDIDFIGEWHSWEGIRCYVCDEISFSESIQSEIPEIRGFFEFMNNEESPAPPKSYAEHIFGYEDAEFSDDYDSFVLDTTKTYAIIYSVNQYGFIITPGFTPRLKIWDYEKLDGNDLAGDKLCDNIVVFDKVEKDLG